MRPNKLKNEKKGMNMKNVNKRTNEILKIVSFITSAVICLVLYYFKIKKMDLWPYEIKSRMVLLCMTFLLLIFCVYLSMKKSMFWMEAAWKFLLPLGILFGMLYLPGRFLIYLPVLLPMVLMTKFYGVFAGCFLYVTAAVCYYFSGFMIMEQIIFMIIMGIMIVFIVGISENRILYILASVLLIIISTILNLIYQYMLYETIHGIPALKQLLPFFITLAPLYIHMAVRQIHSVHLSGKLKEINRDDYFLMEKLSEEDAITYYHSMEVSDLAVRVAVALGINREITMAGARYHEIGKLIGKNYVTHGIKLLHQYGFPKEVIQIVKEHNSKKNKPQSMESAVVMLSDTIVSTLNTIMETRGMGSTNKSKIVKNILEIRLESGILDDVLTGTKEYIRLKQAFEQAYL